MKGWILIALVGGCSGTDTAQPDLDLGLATLNKLIAATPPNGRTPGTNQLIAQLVHDEFVAAGVTDVTIEQFSIPVSSATDHALAFMGSPEIAGTRAHSVNAFGGSGMVVSSPIVDVGNAAGVVPAAAGKVAMLDFSVTRSLRSQYRNVIASGAIGALIDSKIDTLRQRNVWTLAGASAIQGPIPIMTIEQSDAAAIRDQIALGTDVRVDLLATTTVAPMAAYNVIARIPGTTYPDRTLVIDGHLDSWFTGAADDGQAIAALVVLARSLSAHPLPYTVELVAFDSEETFLLGSNDYLSRRMPGARDSLIGAFSLEMLAPKNRVLTIVTLDPKEVWLPALTTGGLTNSFNITLTPQDQMTAFGGEVPSDQGTFWQFGIPGAFVVASYNEYHTVLDDSTNTDEQRFGDVLAELEASVRELGKLPPASFAVRPSSSIEVVPAITARSATKLTGTIGSTNAQTGVPIEDAIITVNLYNATYDTLLGSTIATFRPGTGYTFAIHFNFVAGTSYTVSFDALVSGKSSGRALLRL